MNYGTPSYAAPSSPQVPLMGLFAAPLVGTLPPGVTPQNINSVLGIPDLSYLMDGSYGYGGEQRSPSRRSKRRGGSPGRYGYGSYGYDGDGYDGDYGNDYGEGDYDYVYGKSRRSKKSLAGAFGGGRRLSAAENAGPGENFGFMEGGKGFLFFVFDHKWSWIRGNKVSGKFVDSTSGSFNHNSNFFSYQKSKISFLSK